MRNIRKQIDALSTFSKKRLDKLRDQLAQGVGYRELSGHKLRTHGGPVDWISFPLKHPDRAIVAINKSGEYYLHSAGTHERYNQFVGPKMGQRLNDPWR